MRNRVEYRGNDLIPLRPDEPTTFAGLVYHNWVVTAGIHLMRRSILEQVGAFDPETDPADDWDLVLRTSRYGDIGFAERLVLQWRRHPETLTGTSPRWKSAYFKVRRKMLVDPRNTANQTRLAKLGYTGTSKEILSGSLKCFTRGELAGGCRDFVKAIDAYVRYLAVRTQMVFQPVLSHRNGS
jgi:GT2 family glycosyltransferase